MKIYRPGATLTPQDLSPAARRAVQSIIDPPGPNSEAKAFLAACECGDQTTVEALFDGLAQSILVNGLDKAASSDHAPVTEYLFDRGVECKPFVIRRALARASPAVLDILTAHGWDPCSSDMNSAITNEAAVRWLLARGVKVPDGAIAICAGEGTIAVLNLLLESGASLTNTTALHAAASAGRPDMLAHLLSLSMDIDALDAGIIEPGYSRGTALHYAAFDGQVEAVRFLLDNGATGASSEMIKLTPLAVAKAQHNTELIELLETYFTNQT